MSTVTLEQAKARLDELIARLQPGKEILSTEHGNAGPGEEGGADVVAVQGR